MISRQRTTARLRPAGADPVSAGSSTRSPLSEEGASLLYDDSGPLVSQPLGGDG
ncbi:MAG: hypothetical protein WA997_07900 [Anaerolineales bacterium]